tara:strand:+ start:1761 stop:1958 length:198 start_codon:yes stop_codon:yes gene_type:complete
MTIKKEIEYLEKILQQSALPGCEGMFLNQVGISLRSAATDSRQNKIADHFNIPRQDIESIIQASY